MPNELRAENVCPLAEALPLGVRDAGFGHLVGRIDTGPIHQGNVVQLLFRGEEVFESVRQSIEGATQEILLETYVLRDDATGRKLLDLLGVAAARGVKVRVLADAQQGIARLSSMATSAVSASQAQAGGLLELMGHSIRIKADLLQQVSAAAQAPSLSESQTQWVNFWISAFRLAHSNATTLAQINGTALDSWWRLVQDGR